MLGQRFDMVGQTFRSRNNLFFTEDKHENKNHEIHEETVNEFNPACPNNGQRGKIKLNFYFFTSLWCLRSFNEALKAFIKPFEAPERSVKIKI